jgi:hypothetical protein
MNAQMTMFYGNAIRALYLHFQIAGFDRLPSYFRERIIINDKLPGPNT